ncbi:MAG: hypothetical protein WC788_09225 [Candidatus Paceibacterota bacterium]
MVKQTPGIRISILGKDGEENEELTEALKRLICGETVNIEISAELAVKIVSEVSKHFMHPVDEIGLKTKIMAAEATSEAKNCKCNICIVAGRS